MTELRDQRVLVIGADRPAQAACTLLQQAGAVLHQIEPDAPAAPAGPFALAVLSPAVPLEAPLVQGLRARETPVISELELGLQYARCLSLAVAGTNGKTTTALALERLLTDAGRKVARCGAADRPACEVVGRSRELDFLVVQAAAAQLEATRFFRPSVAVLLNLDPAQPDRYADAERYARALARVFANQQPFDWAIVQAEGLATLDALGLRPPGKLITFTAGEREADLVVDRGLLLSRMADWPGPLLDTGRCRLQGPHNAENLLAALAVGRVLRVPLESMTASLRECEPPPHCLEVVGERQGVRFINDAKATNPGALRAALEAVPSAPGGAPNVWLLAGGRDQPGDFHALAPVISRRVKGAFLLEAARERLRGAWGLFTPCMWSAALSQAVRDAALRAVAGDVVLFSPGCLPVELAQDFRPRGEAFRDAAAAICSGDKPGNPN